jgi:hypothetical protein
VQAEDGWRAIDTTLVETGDVLTPKAAAAHVQISAGGSGPLARVTGADGRSFALEWPTTLPKPVVTGDVATYVNAAGPGDLVVRALSTGFRHDVVLRERPAGAVEYRLPIRSDGLTLAVGASGGLTLRDGKGKTAGSAPPPVMLDANADKRRPWAGRHGKIDTKVVTEGGRQVLVLRPDPAFLADPATKYPLTVDPITTLPMLSDAWIADYGITGAMTQTSDTLYVGTYNESGVPGVERGYLRFDTGAITGANASAATLNLYRSEAIGCGDSGSGIRAQRITATWNPATLTWGNKPATTDVQQATTNDFATCSTPGTMSWDATAFAQAWATGTANHGILLRGVDETVVGRPYYDRGFHSNEGPTNRR